MIRNEDEYMKRKIATLLTIVLAVGLLGGCGGESGSENGNSNAGAKEEGSLEVVNSDADTKENSDSVVAEKDTTLSGYLSTEKTIAYVVSEMDKAKTPKNVYFFEDGKVTIIPGSQFGLTMGDYAKMTDEEIWETYKTVRETYKEKYKTDAGSQSEIENLALDKLYQTYPGYGTFSSSFDYDDFLSACTILNAASGKTYSEAREIDPMEFVPEDTSGSLAQSVDDCLFVYRCATRVSEEAYSKEDYAVLNYFGNEERYGDAVYTGKVWEDAIAFFTNGSEQLVQIRNEISYMGPFYDLPFSFVIETDASGNQVAKEYLVYPTFTDRIGQVPTTYYDSITFANVEGADRQIYDTTYHCFGLGSGGSIFCTRDSMTLDTVDSKKVLIDLTKDEKNELFKEEVLSRYE